ncbi:MAG: hypothetical protein HUU08_02575 [Candidatus Brocadia sp.]|nr:hypothetical protein [Candidatus Brocadia sp.]
MVQRQVLSLGELNDNQRAGWVRTIEAVSGKEHQPGQLALFSDDREANFVSIVSGACGAHQTI